MASASQPLWDDPHMIEAGVVVGRESQRVLDHRGGRQQGRPKQAERPAYLQGPAAQAIADGQDEDAGGDDDGGEARPGIGILR